MTDIEQKALALVNEVATSKVKNLQWCSPLAYKALCRAIEQHEAFRQEVSDAVEDYNLGWRNGTPSRAYYNEVFARFIIAKPDPLVDAVGECDDGTWETKAEYADKLRAAIEKRGGKITWGEG